MIMSDRYFCQECECPHEAWTCPKEQEEPMSAIDEIEGYEDFITRLAIKIEQVEAPRITSTDLSCQVGPEPHEETDHG